MNTPTAATRERLGPEQRKKFVREIAFLTPAERSKALEGFDAAERKQLRKLGEYHRRMERMKEQPSGSKPIATKSKPIAAHTKRTSSKSPASTTPSVPSAPAASSAPAAGAARKNANADAIGDAIRYLREIITRHTEALTALEALDATSFTHSLSK